MLETPDGPSFAMFPNFCPFRQPFGRFSNNSVHSSGRFGVWIFPEYAPTVGGNCWADAPYQAVFDGLTSWRNSKGMEWVMASTIQIKNAIVWDNFDAGLSCVTAENDDATNLPNLRATFYNISSGSSVINSVIIGDTGTSAAPVVATIGGLVGKLLITTGFFFVDTQPFFEIFSHVGSWSSRTKCVIYQFYKLTNTSSLRSDYPRSMFRILWR